MAGVPSGVDQVNDVLIVQDLVDRPGFGIPQLIPVWQQDFEDAALRVRATEHAASMEVDRVRCAAGKSASNGIRITMGNASEHVKKIERSDRYPGTSTRENSGSDSPILHREVI